MEAEGDAMTFVTHDDEGDIRAIERTLGKAIPRVTLPDFDYNAPPPPKTRGHEGGRPQRSWRPQRDSRRPRRGPPRR